MITLRNATLPELDLILDWAADEGWNPGLDDARAFRAADPDGFFVAVDGSDRPVAAISVVNHNDDFAFLGLYIVRPEYRGKGIGYRLWTHALHHAAERTVGLDGVEAQQQNYAASGFVHAGGTTRFSGHVPGVMAEDLRVATAEDVSDLIALEAAASGVKKPGYLTAWYGNTENRVTLVTEEAGTIGGFCTVRNCRTGAKIGPLVAETAQIAERLIAHAAAWAQGAVTIDVPEHASELRNLCDRLGLEPGFRTARMYRGPFSTPGHPLFAVTSLELG